MLDTDEFNWDLDKLQSNESEDYITDQSFTVRNLGKSFISQHPAAIFSFS